MSTSSFTSNGLYIVGAGLLFLVLSSKNILIYNEELLILLSFLAFVATSAHTMGDSVAETLHSRRELIQEELQAFFTTKQNMLSEVKHQTILQNGLANSILALGSLVQKELQSLHAQRDMTVKNTVQTHSMAQLNQMLENEQASYARVQSLSCASYKFMMKNAFHMEKQKMHKQFMENALHHLKNMHQKKMQAKAFAGFLKPNALSDVHISKADGEVLRSQPEKSTSKAKESEKSAVKSKDAKAKSSKSKEAKALKDKEAKRSKEERKA